MCPWIDCSWQLEPHLEVNVCVDQVTGKFLTYMQIDPKYPLSPISLVIIACVEVPPLPDFFLSVGGFLYTV